MNRTEITIRQQIEAMGCQDFEIGIRDVASGRMILKTWSSEEISKSVGYLKHSNAQNSDIYIRPAPSQNQNLVLMDDLDKTRLTELIHDGLTPSLVIETSPKNFQTWIKIPEIDQQTRTAVGKFLAKRYGADPNSTDWRHFGRLAGFTNRKPNRTLKDGRQPWVYLRLARGEPALKGAELVETVRKELESQPKPPRPDFMVGRVIDHNPKQVFERVYRSSIMKNGDASKADFAAACILLRNGFDSNTTAQVMADCSPELKDRKKGHVEDYCHRTVKSAYKTIGRVEEVPKKSYEALNLPINTSQMVSPAQNLQTTIPYGRKN